MYCQYTYNMVGVIKVKTEVLRMLKETDDYLSGQEICGIKVCFKEQAS